MNWLQKIAIYSFDELGYIHELITGFMSAYEQWKREITAGGAWDFMRVNPRITDMLHKSVQKYVSDEISFALAERMVQESFKKLFDLEVVNDLESMNNLESKSVSAYQFFEGEFSRILGDIQLDFDYAEEEIRRVTESN